MDAPLTRYYCPPWHRDGKGWCIDERPHLDACTCWNQAWHNVTCPIYAKGPTLAYVNESWTTEEEAP